MNMCNMIKLKLALNSFVSKFQPCYCDETGRNDYTRAVNTFDGVKKN